MSIFSKPSKGNASVFRSALIMAVGTFSSRLVALIREVLLAAYFPRFVTDIWIVALRIPNLCRRLFGESSLSVAFIPIFVGLLENNQPDAAKKLVDIVFSLISILLLVFFTLGLIFTPEIIHWLTVGEAFSQIEGKVQLTIHFTRIMMVFLILVCLYAFFMSVQNSLKRFAAAAFAPAFFNLSIVIAVFLPSSLFKIPGEVLAWAVVVGGFLQLFIVIPGVWRLGFLPRFQWNIIQNLQFKPARKVLQKLLPSLIGVGVLQLTVLVNTRFASYLQEGANSWIFWADRLLELPLSLIAVSMSTALLPTLSEYFAKGLFSKMSNLMNESLRYLFFLGIPAGVGLFLLSELIIQVIFERGHFGSEDVMYTSAVLRIYGASIFSYGGIRVLQPAFYAIGNTWLPALVSGSCLIFHIVFASYLLDPYGIEGLAFSSVTSATLNLCLLLLSYKLLIGSLGYLKLLLSLLRTLLASLVMAAGLQVMLHYYSPETFWNRLFFLFVICTIGFLLYFITAFCLNSREAMSFLGKIKHYLKIKNFN